jgi:hypothetical protein
MRKTYDIKVEVLNCIEERTAIATAASYLAYADQTNTIGYAPEINAVFTHTDGDGPIAVTLNIIVSLQNDSRKEKFLDEMEHLSKVISVKEDGVSLL